jgi:cysteine synthase A
MTGMVDNITRLIGQTPVVQLRRMVPKGYADVFVKLESFNPGGSVKDRPAYNMISEAEKDGLIQPGDTIVEPTSGNTGIGLAMVAAALGYKAVLVMPDTMTKERIQIVKAYGAQVVLTPGRERMTGAVAKAEQLLKEIPNSFMPQQFKNVNNPNAHRGTTALEIMEQMGGKLDAFVSAAGTGGTVTGVGETLKRHLPDIKIYVVEPQGSPVLSGGKPGPHKIVGTSPGFVPDILNTKIYDEIFQISDDDGQHYTREMARKEGILVGTSSGAAVWGALKAAKRLGSGKRVLAIAPDTGERYLSSDLFA